MMKGFPFKALIQTLVGRKLEGILDKQHSFSLLKIRDYLEAMGILITVLMQK